MVACVSSEVMCMGLFFNPNNSVFWLWFFSHLLLKYTRMLFFVLEDVLVQKSDCFLRGISYWWHYWLSGHGQCEGFRLTFLSVFLKGQHTSARPCPFLGSLSQTDWQFKQCLSVLICTFDSVGLNIHCLYLLVGLCICFVLHLFSSLPENPF